MKTKTCVATTFANILLVAAPLTVLSQGGPLTPPPGPPAPTMRTLDTVEPRIPLVEGAPGITIGAEGQITITQSGSYYLTQNLDFAAFVTGVTIDADGVTVDLMGHAIRYTGAGNAGNAIFITTDNVTIQNGHILSTTTHDGSSFTTGGFFDGVSTNSNTQRGITVRNLSIQGVRGSGIFLQGTANRIENCTVNVAGNNGIRATGTGGIGGLVRNCVVHQVGQTGIWAQTVQSCRVENADSSGIYAQTVTDSYATSTGASGIFAIRSVTGSHGETSSANQSYRGISAQHGVVTNSTGISSGGHGIFANVVNSSRGISSGTHGANSSGIHADVVRGTVTDSFGESTASGGGHGIHASNVNGSNGFAANGALNGIDANLVTHSYGSRGSTEATRFGIRATQANGSQAAQGEQITHKFNMP